MKGHQDLSVWHKAMDLVIATYALTRAFPKSEIYGLCSQMQRAAVSVPSNIPEGQALKQTLAYARHLAIASGSLAELQTQLEIARRLGYFPAASEGIIAQADEVARMLAGLRKSLLAVAES
ncbi:MAG TPA: four helix bundle protein [Terriglobia bacterium]|nr:four helix bundle protein [Terriglobia bacterium]